MAATHPEAHSGQQARRSPGAAGSKRELYCLMALVALCAILGLDLFTTHGGFQSVLAPSAYAAVAVLAGVGSLVQLLRRGPHRLDGRTDLGRLRILGVFFLPVLFVVLWPILGLRFYFAAPIILTLGAWVIRAHRPLWRLALLIVGIDVFVWLVFANFLKVPL